MFLYSLYFEIHSRTRAAAAAAAAGKANGKYI